MSRQELIWHAGAQKFSLFFCAWHPVMEAKASCTNDGKHGGRLHIHFLTLLSIRTRFLNATDAPVSCKRVCMRTHLIAVFAYSTPALIGGQVDCVSCFCIDFCFIFLFGMQSVIAMFRTLLLHPPPELCLKPFIPITLKKACFIACYLF